MEKKITLVVVDFQYDFCLLGAPLYVPGSDRALWNISHLIENKKIDEVKVIYAPDITICSTAIRKWVDDGKIILPFVTDEVYSIIRKLGLYR